MKFPEINPLADRPKGNKAPGEALVGKFLGAEARGIFERLHRRPLAAQVVDEEEPADLKDVSLNEQEQLVLEIARLERELEPTIKEAQTAALNIEDPYIKSTDLSQLASAAFQVDYDVSELLGAAQQAANYHQGSVPKIFSLLASAQFLAGHREEASKSESRIHPSHDRGEDLRNLITTLAQMGRLEDAQVIAKKIRGSYFPALAFSNFAIAQKRVGQDPSEALNRAKESAEKIRWHNYRAKAFASVASAYVECGLDASEMHANIRTAISRVEEDDADYFEMLLIQLVLAPNEEDVSSILEKVRGDLLKNEDPFFLAKALVQFAAALIKIGHDPSETLGQAREAITRLEGDPYHHSQALVFLGSVLAQAGQVSSTIFHEAHEVALDISGVHDRAQILTSLVETLAQSLRLLKERSLQAQSLEV